MRTRIKIGAPTGLLLAAAVALGASTGVARAEPADSARLAQTPPMGWLSFIAFGKKIDENLIKQEADAMVASGMRDAGYRYLIVDGGWRATTRDADGNMQANPVTFPHGMKALGDYIHSKGLKFGLHQAVGYDDCAHTDPGTASAPDATYEERAARDARTFASWGLDYLRFDWCGANNDGRPADMPVEDWKKELYGAMGRALRATGRPIVYSTMEYGVDEPWTWAAGLGSNLWRTTADIRPLWDAPGTRNAVPMGVTDVIDVNGRYAQYAGPGHWNDPDPLVLGIHNASFAGLTDVEGRSQMSMWAIMAAPLIASADLRTMSAATRETMLNRDVIAIDQDPAGMQGTRLSDDGDHEAWVKPLADGERAVALFNRGETPARIETSATAIGLDDAPAYVLRDLWAHDEHTTAGTISAFVPAHGTTLLRVRPGTPADAPPATTLSLDAARAEQAPGAPATAGATLSNDGRVAVEDAELELDVPAGWSVQPRSATGFDAIAPETSAAARWTVTPPANAPAGDYELHAIARYRVGQRLVTSEARYPVTIPHTFDTPVDLAGVFDKDGITADGDFTDGSFDLRGTTYPAEDLPAPGREALGDIPVLFPDGAHGALNTVEAHGQTIELPAGHYSAAAILGASRLTSDTMGVVHYADGSSATVPLRFSNWSGTGGSPNYGETVAVRTTHRHKPTGDVAGSVRMLMQVVDLDPSRTALSLTLPDQGVNPTLNLFALTLDSVG